MFFLTFLAMINILALGHSAIASPTVSPTPGLETYEAFLVQFIEVGSDISESSKFGWNSTNSQFPASGGLEGRSEKPDDCWRWPRGISDTVQKYKSDLGALRSSMKSSEGGFE
jgi:hypothetical protein